jgi:hypothetical protein
MKFGYQPKIGSATPPKLPKSGSNVDLSANVKLDNVVILSAIEYSDLLSTINRLMQYDEERDHALHARLISDAKAENSKEIFEKLNELFKNRNWNWNHFHDTDVGQKFLTMAKEYGVIDLCR